jgi:chorismate synthase
MVSPYFRKLDGEIGACQPQVQWKAVEIGAGYAVKGMKGSECNDQMVF